jgi:hypothetical protein
MRPKFGATRQTTLGVYRKSSLPGSFGCLCASADIISRRFADPYYSHDITAEPGIRYVTSKNCSRAWFCLQRLHSITTPGQAALYLASSVDEDVGASKHNRRRSRSSIPPISPVRSISGSITA